MVKYREHIPAKSLAALRQGVVIPAHPLALDGDRKFDRKYQRALTRYYAEAGVGGMAVGVHTTQFAIRDPKIGLFELVLELASQTIDEYANRGIVKIGGIVGKTDQAIAEAELLLKHGYHAALMSMAAFAQDPEEGVVGRMIQHSEAVAEIMPVFGFYLQPAVGGRVLPYTFWKKFAEIENVVAIKIAPFNRYQTLDVVRAVAEAGRATGENRIALYTGNDDNIVADLLATYAIDVPNGEAEIFDIVGGLLGHWAVNAKASGVELLRDIHELKGGGTAMLDRQDYLTLNGRVTDMNAAFFDAAYGFAGCIAGLHEVLSRQGLMQSNLTLNPAEGLSPGQSDEITRVLAQNPTLNDDEFIAANLDRWLAD